MHMHFDHNREYQLLNGLAPHARVDLGPTRTPLMPAPRLGLHLGIELHIKRDDTQPLGMGGNKVRQLEYYLGPAKETGANTVLITGAVQSNFVRLCAAACRKLGWHPVVQLEKRVPDADELYRHSGNVLLDKLYGAEIHYFAEGENEAAADANLDHIAAEKKRHGHSPYVIHLGTDHPPLGALGYALAAAETYLQLSDAHQAIDHVVIPTGSGLTHSGFLAGAHAIDWQIPIHGICVRRKAALQQKRIEQRVSEVSDLLQLESPVQSNQVLVNDNVLAPGYGQLNDQVNEAIKLTAELEGVLLDPVYSGRCMAGLIDLVRTGVIGQGDRVLFVHTGGVPALFAYGGVMGV